MDVTRSQLLRSLVILGALIGLFALHGPGGQPQQAAVTQTGITAPVTAHATVERLEQVAMVAPLTVAVDTSDHQHLLVPCALAIGSVLLLGLGLLLSRQRFGDAPPRSPGWRVPRLRALVPDPPDLTRLCILRT